MIEFPLFPMMQEVRNIEFVVCSLRLFEITKQNVQNVPSDLIAGYINKMADLKTICLKANLNATAQHADYIAANVEHMTLRSLHDSLHSLHGMPSATGSTTLTDLTITVLGTSVTIPVNPTPNDVIFRFAGLTITLNQQIPDLSESAGITTNAIAIDFNRFPFGTNRVSGSVDVAQSFASLNVPETSTWVMLLLGFAGLGYAGYRKSRPTVSIA